MALACPCGSEETYRTCCRPYLTGEREAPDAATLMRSRYTAYAVHDEPYVLRTWHPSTRPGSVQVGGLTWFGLSVGDAVVDPNTPERASVTFSAHWYDQRGIPEFMRETSRFVRERGIWLYVDGDVS